MKRTEIMIAAGLFLLAQAALADWTPAKRITWTSGFSGYPSLATNSAGVIYLVWQDDTPGDDEVYFKKSTDGGSSWTAGKRISWTEESSLAPSIVLDSSGNLHVVWYEYLPGYHEVFYTRSTDGGNTWIKAKSLTPILALAYYPSLAIDSADHLHVVWEEASLGEKEIFYKKSTDGGSTWTTSKRITWTADNSYQPCVSTDVSSNLFVVWSDDTSGSEIHFKKSIDGGSSWTTGKRISWLESSSVSPSIAADSSSNLHVVWYEYLPGYHEVFYTISTDGGNTWIKPKNLTAILGMSYDPSLAIDSSDDLHVVWTEDSAEGMDLYYRKSLDGGSNWTMYQRLTWTAGESRYPAICADLSGNLHLVWQDDTPGNNEVYYKTFNK